MKNYIVIRHSPDWLRFDLDQSREFCRFLGIPETTLLDFSAAWDGCLAVTYRKFRHSLKCISLKNFECVKSATVVEQRDLSMEMLTNDSIVAFVDDDDWFSPHVFESLRQSLQDDGYLWASLRIGHDFMIRSPDKRIGPAEKQVGPLTYRKKEKFIYTNNYAVFGRILQNGKIEDYLEHSSAQARMDAGQFRPIFMPIYLSCANKHPASTVAAQSFIRSENFRRNPRDELARAFSQILTLELTDPDLQWLKGPLDRLKNLLDAALK